jgi:prepilin-type N-terminal cleavage/methylation domain-containing protein
MQKKYQNGFTLLELAFTLAIISLIYPLISSMAGNYFFQLDAQNKSAKFSQVITAVNKRTQHDGFDFIFWDENGGTTASNSALSWDANAMDDFFSKYLTGRKNIICGDAANGWNPINTDGTLDGGVELAIEKSALFPCNALRNNIPYNFSMSALLIPDNNDQISEFILYLDTTRAMFSGDVSKFDRLLTFQEVLTYQLTRNNGFSPTVEFVKRNDLDDKSDDSPLTVSQCEAALKADEECSISITLSFSGGTNGFLKKTSNANSFIDDVTFMQNIAEGRQQCAIWEVNSAGLWESNLTDCAIKAGVGDDNVGVVVDYMNSNSLLITDEADLTHLCNQYDQNGNGKLILAPAPDDKTPCGIMKNGSIVQLITDEIHAKKTFSEELIADSLFASQASLYSDLDGQVMLQVFNSARSNLVFSIDNRGNVTAEGDLAVSGDSIFEGTSRFRDQVTMDSSVEMNLQDGGTVIIGDTVNGLVFSKKIINSEQIFSMESTSSAIELINNNGTGISTSSATGEEQLTLNASGGVVARNGTTIHNSKSTLNGLDFNPSGTIDSDALRMLSQSVSYDHARYLSDTSSNIPLVGIVRVEGDFTTIVKPDCLDFTDNANYISPDYNPYKNLLGTLPSGESLARLVLISQYHKTYNASFGDNQLFALHAAHSSETEWDVYLYLAGEGSIGTGAREDGAGVALGMILCDYSSIDFENNPL